MVDGIRWIGRGHRTGIEQSIDGMKANGHLGGVLSRLALSRSLAGVSSLGKWLVAAGRARSKRRKL